MPEHHVDVALVGRDRDELHAALAPWASEDVGGEHPAEEPWPRMPGGGGSGRRLERGGGADFEKRELNGLFFFIVGRSSRNDLGPDLGMGSEDAVIPEHVEPRRRDEGAEAWEKIEGVENGRACPVFPGGLEAIANPALVRQVESVLGEGRPCDVAAEALESLTVEAALGDLGVDVGGDIIHPPAETRGAKTTGPEAITLSDATERFIAACHPSVRVMRLTVWQARLVARLLGNDDFADVTELVAYLDVAGEHGDPSEANELYGAPTITLDDWCTMPMDSRGGMPH